MIATWVFRALFVVAGLYYLYLMAFQRLVASDLYMNFKPMRVLMDVANTTTLVEQEYKTGMGFRGDLIWLIHLIEARLPVSEIDNNVQAALSTKKAAVSIPGISDAGCIDRFENLCKITTTGYHVVQQPVQHKFMPPIPIAGPNLSLYARSSANDAAIQGDYIDMRLGFTTAPLTTKEYLEIAEAWGY